jgi:hypothetical protein
MQPMDLERGVRGFASGCRPNCSLVITVCIVAVRS